MGASEGKKEASWLIPVGSELLYFIFTAAIAENLPCLASWPCPHTVRQRRPRGGKKACVRVILRLKVVEEMRREGGMEAKGSRYSFWKGEIKLILWPWSMFRCVQTLEFRSHSGKRFDKLVASESGKEFSRVLTIFMWETQSPQFPLYLSPPFHSVYLSKAN